jgi:glutamate-ammonia-ligase adenylyltransferase
MAELDRIKESSQYLATLLQRRPEFTDWLWIQKKLYRRYPLTELYQDLKQTMRQIPSFDDLLVAFREFKQRHFLRIGGRDLLGWADLLETTAQLSDLACVTLQVGLETLTENPQWWDSENSKNKWWQIKKDLRLVIMGLGKLGGRELNYVSDVDILFLNASQDEGSLQASEDIMTVNRLCQWLARLLADQVEGDRVFQVDFRLRPQGKDGALVPSLAGAAEYYLLHGLLWERQMLLKARPAAGDHSLGMTFLNEVRPFVFRRFLDFQALDEMRSMRDRILNEAPRPRPDWKRFDVKLGRGGIREIEFLVQSFQLIYGGRYVELEEPNTLRCMDHLHQLELLPDPVLDELKEAYVFLRRVEHWIQLDQNRQTQKLPQSKEARMRLSLALGFEGKEKAFLKKLEECCTAVHEHFKSLFHSEDRVSTPDSGDLEPEKEASELLDSLQSLFPEPHARLQTHLQPFPPPFQSTVLEVLQSYAQLRDREIGEKILVRLERYLSQVRRRPGLAKLFHSPASWHKDLCQGMARTELVSDLLSHQPSLVEGIASWSGSCPDTKTWEKTGQHILTRYESYEESVEWIRRLKNERLLQLALTDLKGTLSQKELEESLSDLADFVIRQTLETIRKSQGFASDLPLTILTLGKLGSREMNYLSDLDLIFVYQPEKETLEDQIPGQVIRMIQRIIRMLSIPLQEGPGYEVDARLRPTGSYGPLVVTRNSWQNYYAYQADLWEIQALLRIRAVAGDEALGQWIEQEAKNFCYQEWDSVVVRSSLCHLRQRMEQERTREGRDIIDLKLGYGGLADLEFLIQGHQLIYGHSDSQLQNRDTRSVMEAVLKKTLDPESKIRELIDAFRVFRYLEHRLHLYHNQSTSRLTKNQFESLCALNLLPIKQGDFPVEEWEDILHLRRRVRQAWEGFCSE